MKSWPRWLLRSLSRTLIISGLTVMLTWNMVEMYMNRWAAELGLADEVGRAHFKDWLLHLQGVDVSAGKQTPFERLSEQSDEQSPTLSGEWGKSDEAEWTGEQDDPDVAGTEDRQVHHDEELPNAAPVFGYLIEEDQERSDELVMSSDDLVSWQEAMTDEDKLTIFSLVMAKLPQHEYQNLSYLLEEGLTSGEMVQLYETLSQYLTEEELSDIANILQKYE